MPVCLLHKLLKITFCYCLVFSWFLGTRHTWPALYYEWPSQFMSAPGLILDK